MKTLEYLRGITAEECTRLRDRGIRHSNQLLHACTLHFDRDRISRKTGISTERLLYFAHECALLEISGMERFLPVLRALDQPRPHLGRVPEAAHVEGHRPSPFHPDRGAAR